MLLLKELGMVLALACTIGVTTWETLHTAERLWQRVEAMLEMFQSVPLPGEDHDAKVRCGQKRTKPDRIRTR